MILFEKLLANVAKKPKFVHFEDTAMKRICVERWDKDGDGELSMEEAAAVSSIGTIHIPFGSKFNELKYFSGWNPKKWITDDFVYFDDVVGEVTIPQQITQVGNGWKIKFTSKPRTQKNIIIRFLGEMKEIGYWSISDDIKYRGEAFSILLPNSPTPPIFHRVWVGETYNSCKALYVPDGSVGAYKAANINEVKKILPISEYQG